MGGAKHEVGTEELVVSSEAVETAPAPRTETILICKCSDCDSWIVTANKLICQTCDMEVPIATMAPPFPAGVHWASVQIEFGTDKAFNPKS